EAVAEVLVHRKRQHVAAGVAAVVDARTGEEDELLGMLYRQQVEQHFVDQRENRGVGADAERDRRECDDGEDRRPRETAAGVAKVPSKVAHHGWLDGTGGGCVDW